MKKRDLIYYTEGQLTKFKLQFIDNLLKHTYISLSDTRLRDFEVSDLILYFHQKGYLIFATSIHGRNLTKKSELATIIKQSAVDKAYNIDHHRQKRQGRGITVSYHDDNFIENVDFITVYLGTKNKLDKLLYLICFIHYVV